MFLRRKSPSFGPLSSALQTAWLVGRLLAAGMIWLLEIALAAIDISLQATAILSRWLGMRLDRLRQVVAPKY
jgi:hypothetical protein